MLSLIEVRCPHCGAQGQIMLPPVGAIIIGPCPECKGAVVVFCGKVLPLDNAIMEMEEAEPRKAHLLAVLTQFLHDRIEHLFSQQDRAAEPAREPPGGGEAPEAEPDNGAPLDEAAEARPSTPRRDSEDRTRFRPISEDEFQSFVQVDLKLLDNKDYFRAIFD